MGFSSEGRTVVLCTYVGTCMYRSIDRSTAQNRWDKKSAPHSFCALKIVDDDDDDDYNDEDNDDDGNNDDNSGSSSSSSNSDIV